MLAGKAQIEDVINRKEGKNAFKKLDWQEGKHRCGCEMLLGYVYCVTPVGA